MKKQTLLSIIFLFLIFNLSAQQDLLFEENNLALQEANLSDHTIIAEESKAISTITKELELLIHYFTTEVEYPELSRKNNIEGQVILQFVFDGRIKDVKIVKSLNPECDEMIEKKMKGYIEKWNHSAENKIPEMTVNMPVNFRLKG